MLDLEKKLDLNKFIDDFRKFFAREQKDNNLDFDGDLNFHMNFIKSLENEGVVFNPPQSMSEIWESISLVKKFGLLSLSQIYEIVKIVRYFLYLKNVNFVGIAKDWIEKINIPAYFLELNNLLNNDGKFNDESDPRLFSISIGIAETRENIRSSLYSLVHSQRIAEYLVDSQIHFLNDREALLMKGGYSSVIKGDIIGRSSSGFFYISPDLIANLNNKIRDYEAEREAIYLNYRREISKKLNSFVLFLKFIDREFDRFDNYQARLFFAKSRNLEFVLPVKDQIIKIQDFYHPAIQHSPKPLSIDFSKKVLLITGVNAGGKTMLLKSILSAVYLAKYLIPMKINSYYSTIGKFKNIEAVIDDPQNINFDISTFAGRMVAFANLLSKDRQLIGVDEVELGTDADEASSLFKILIEKLMDRESKIVITTHHKRLASLLGGNPEVELVAALYDEEKRMPTYRFLQGIVGKSYAFETAERYGIPATIVNEARKLYGDDREKLNELIEKGANLERELLEKRDELNKKLESIVETEQELIKAKNKFLSGIEVKRDELKNIYSGAIEEAKSAIRAKNVPDSHRHMTTANKLLPKDQNESIENEIERAKIISGELKVGDEVVYKSNRGKILTIKGKFYQIEIGGIKIDLKREQIAPAPEKNINIDRHKNSYVFIRENVRGDIYLDLHGKRREEALEEMDQFISNALINGFSEVYITHGIGGGILAKAVIEFLRNHPSVKWFGDAPPNQGGTGAKLVML